MKKIIIYLYLLILLLPAAGDGSIFYRKLLQTGHTFNTGTLVKLIQGDLPYRVTPGDHFGFKLIIKNPSAEQDTDFSLSPVLSDKYELELPYLGTINLRGMLYTEARTTVIKRMKAILPTLYFIDFYLTYPALFEIFVYGKVNLPGNINITSLTRADEAILLAGGIEPGSSIRKIQLIRDSEVQVLDFLKYQMEGDVTQNPILQPGDRILVPQAEIMCTINGQVAYTGTYELLPGETLQHLIDMAGGILPEGSTTGILLARISDDNNTTYTYLDLQDAPTVELLHGDIIEVKSKIENSQTVQVEGALFGKPFNGKNAQEIPRNPILLNTPFIPGMTLLQILDFFGGPTPYADTVHSVLFKSNGEKIYLDIGALWTSKDNSLDVPLEPGDHIFIPMLPLTVTVGGMVHLPDTFVFINETTVAEYLIRAGGIMLDQADQNSIYQLSLEGDKTPLAINTPAVPGMFIYVDQSNWIKFKSVLSEINVVFTMAGSIATLVAAVVQVISVLNPTSSVIDG